MTREVMVGGQRVKLYKVSKFATGWCSDRNLANRIVEKREKTLRECRLNSQDIKKLVRL